MKRGYFSLFVFVVFVTIIASSTMGESIDEYPAINKTPNNRLQNRPPNPPEISGPTYVVVLRYYTYSFKLTDPDGDYLSKLQIYWGDGTFFEIGINLKSGSVIKAKKMWKKQGSFEIKARVADNHSAWSEWAYYRVTVPTSGFAFYYLEKRQIHPSEIQMINLGCLGFSSKSCQFFNPLINYKNFHY